jgi:general secretion pathway protein B
MSLILDALKKSEAQRQRGQIPTLTTPSMRSSRLYQEETRPGKWWWISIILIVFALGITTVWWWQMDKSVAFVPTVAAPIAPITTASTAIFPEKQTVEKKQVAAPEKTNTETVPAKSASEANPLDNKKIAAPTNTTTFSDPPKQAVIEVTTPISPAVETSSAPYLSTMASDLRQHLPTMKLSMHVYTNEPSKRFAIIDGQRVNEGSTIGNAIVERINTEGVIVSVQGQSYLVPRP